MKLFDTDLDVDSEMLRLIDEYKECDYPDYIIMSKTTFTVFSELSKCVNKKKMNWEYDFETYSETYSIAIDRGLKFGEVIIK